MKKEYLIPDLEIIRVDFTLLDTTLHLSSERPNTIGDLGGGDDDGFDLDSMIGDVSW